MKKIFETRFKELYPKKRLLAIQLDGFTHKVYFDDGKKNSAIETETASAYILTRERAKKLFLGYPNYTYQNNSKEIVYTMPQDR